MDEKERQRQYQEYLSLREKHHPEEDERMTYGESEMRRLYHEKAQRERTEDICEDRRQPEREEYLAARESQSEGEGKAKRKLPKLPKRQKKQKKQLSQRARNRRKKTKRGLIIRIILIILLLAAIFVVGGGIFAFAALNSMDRISIDKSELAINPEVATQLDNYDNIAILGTDARANSENSRSDAIIVASINKETNEVKLFSVFRDTLLDVGEQGLDKVTHAYFYGGAQQSLYALNKNLDLNIDKVVVINWKTVADMIDSVGGITINVKESELDELNKYIHETAINVDGPADKVEKAGKQKLNGVQAVTYARIRKDAATGDYRRNERMKIVFSQTFKEVRSAGYLKMLNVAMNVLPEVGTNIPSGDLLKIMLKYKSYDMTDSTTGFPYDVGSWTGYAAAGYAWYGPPINLTNNVSKLHEQFFEQGGYTPTETVQEISAQISALTGLY